MTLAIARGTEEIDSADSRLAWIIVTASSGLLLLLFGALSWTVSNALGPLNSLALQIAGVDEHSLATRFDAANVPAEILPIVERANCLMLRLEQAFIQERTFTADVAHELRTPLAGLRSTLQVALSRPRDSAEYREAMNACEAISAGLQRLVETLLTLARLEGDDAAKDWGHIDVSVLVENAWRPFEEPSRQRELHVTRNGPEGVFLYSDTTNCA
jgi:signal transduction histidine kinase